MNRNLWILPAFQAAAFGYAIVPFVWLLVAGHGLGFDDYAALQSVYYVTTLLAEMPTGILADRIGRRAVLILAGVAQAAGFSILGVAGSFVAFAAAHVLLGIGQAMLSGTTAAMLYDSLKAEGRENQYLHKESRNTLYRLSGSSVAFMVGGVLGKAYGFEAAAWASAGFSVLAIGLAFLLTEPPRDADPVHSAGLHELVLSSFDTVWRDRGLRWIALTFALLFVELRVAFHFYTPGLERAGIRDPISIGVAFAVLNFVAAGSARLTPRFLGSLREASVLLTLTAILALSFGLLSLTHNATLVVACFLLQQVPFGIHFPIVNAMVNHRVGSARRATVFSCLSLIGRLLFALSFPLVGALVNRFDLGTAFCAVAASSALCGVLLYRALRQVRSLSGGTETPVP